MTLRSRTHQVLEGHHERIGKTVRWFLAVLIVTNVFAVVNGVETYADVRLLGDGASARISLSLHGVESDADRECFSIGIRACKT